jgi:hypothetical protein
MTGETMSDILVCSECAAGIANDDWTHLDFYDDDEVSTSVACFVESHGYLALVDAEADAPGGGYFRCPCCGSDAIGGATFSQE